MTSATDKPTHVFTGKWHYSGRFRTHDKAGKFETAASCPARLVAAICLAVTRLAFAQWSQLTANRGRGRQELVLATLPRGGPIRRGPTEPQRRERKRVEAWL